MNALVPPPPRLFHSYSGSLRMSGMKLVSHTRPL